MVLKIRTMYENAEASTGPVLCKPRDKRITPVGKVLRYLHLDELPQLVNVIRGEMGLVGPRPERPEIIKRQQLNERVPGFINRTSVAPGVTGLAQINLPADQTVECVVPKVRLDLEYIETATVSLDLRILLCTCMWMLGARNGHAVRLLGLRRDATIGDPGAIQKPRHSRNGFQKVALNGASATASNATTSQVANGSANGKSAGSITILEASADDLRFRDYAHDHEPDADDDSEPLPRKPR